MTAVSVTGPSKAVSSAPLLPPTDDKNVRAVRTPIKMDPGAEKSPITYRLTPLQDTWAPSRAFRQNRTPENLVSIPELLFGLVDKMAELLRDTCGAPVRPEELYFYEYGPPQQELVWRRPYVSTAAVPRPLVTPQPQPIYTVVPVQPQTVPPPAHTVIVVRHPAQPKPWAVREVGICPLAERAGIRAEPAGIRAEPQKMLCFGHQGDERKLCFGLLTLPPRQIKYDIVVERVSTCLGLWSKDTFVAVCRKCRKRLSTCPHCHKQSVVFHP